MSQTSVIPQLRETSLDMTKASLPILINTGLQSGDHRDARQ